MATNIPLPSSGQPLDLSYLTTIVTSINDLYSLTNASAFNKSSKIAASPNKQTTSELIFAAERVVVSVGTAVAAKGLVSGLASWGYNGVNFINAPVVSITVESAGTTVGVKSIIPILNSVTATSVTYDLYTPDGIPTGTYYLHFTAIGY
jgi:hypothetical protein